MNEVTLWKKKITYNIFPLFQNFQKKEHYFAQHFVNSKTFSSLFLLLLAFSIISCKSFAWFCPVHCELNYTVDVILVDPCDINDECDNAPNLKSGPCNMLYSKLLWITGYISFLRSLQSEVCGKNACFLYFPLQHLSGYKSECAC